MRGKLVQQEGKLLVIGGLLDCLLGMGTIGYWFLNHSVLGMIVGVFLLCVGVFCLIVWFRINYPKMPEWAEDELKSWGERPKIKRL